MNLLHSIDFSTIEWLLLLITALMVGLAKSGLSGVTMLVIPLLATVFGGKESTGILLPMLILGDTFAIWYYHQHADWSNIRKLLPWAVLGLLAGVVAGNYMDDRQFKILIAVMVLLCLILLILTEKKGGNIKIPETPFVYIFSGIAAGFATMIGNAAGPIFSVYLLAKGFKKNDFMGTTAWFFFIINVSKLPLQIFVWKNVSLATISISFFMIPAIALGAFLGSRIIKKINEKIFKNLIIIMTAIAAIRLFI